MFPVFKCFHGSQEAFASWEWCSLGESWLLQHIALLTGWKHSMGPGISASSLSNEGAEALSGPPGDGTSHFCSLGK